MYVKELDIFLKMKVLDNTPAVLSLGWLCDEHGYPYAWINGQKPHVIKNGIRRQCKTENFVPIVVLGLSTSSSSSFPSSTSMTLSRQETEHPTSSSSSSTSTPMTSSKEIDHSDHPPAIVSSESVDRQVREDPYSSETSEELLTKPTKNPKNEKKKRESRVSTERPVPFRHTPEHRDSHASSSHEPSLELMPARSADLGKHSVYTNFPKDRNCEICERTKITIAPCRRRTGGAVPRAENFGDLITAYHKVLSDNCESRNNHRYAVVVQDLATQWIQPYPCKTKTSQEIQKSLQKFLEPDRKPRVIYTDNALELAKRVKIFPGIIVRRHHTDRKRMGLLREQYAE